MALPEFVIKLPELALNVGGLSGVGRGLGLGVEAEREILGHPANALAILLAQLGEGGLDTAAEGALVVDEFYNGDGGVGGALGGVVIFDNTSGGGGKLFLLMIVEADEDFVAVLFKVFADDGFDIGAGEGGGVAAGGEGAKGEEEGEKERFHGCDHGGGAGAWQGGLLACEARLVKVGGVR